MTEEETPAQTVAGDGNIVIGQTGGSVTVTVGNGPTRRLPLDPPTRPGVEGMTLPPSLRLHPRYSPVGLVGRDQERIELVEWATTATGTQAAIRLVGGQGGAGKTRLGLELCWALPDDWVCGFLKADADQEQLEELTGTGVPRLVAIDYAETRALQLEQLLTLAVEQRTSALLRIVLLVRRHDVSTTASLLGPSAQELTALFAHNAEPPLLLDDRPLTTTARESLFRQAVEAFGEGERAVLPALDDQAFAIPLMILSHAYVTSVAGREQPAHRPERFELLDAVLAHEQRYWGTSPVGGQSMGAKVIAATTLCSTADANDTAELLRFVLPELADAAAVDLAQLAEWAQGLYPPIEVGGTRWIRPVEPDLIGEHLVAGSLTADNWTRALQRPDESVVHTLRLLQRLVADRSDRRVELDTVLTTELQQLCDRARAQATTASVDDLFHTGELLAPVLTELVADANIDLEILDAVVPSLPMLNLILNPLSLSLSQRRVDGWRRRATTGTGEAVHLAGALVDLSTRFDDLGRPDLGLEPLQEALSIYRPLAEADPAAYLPDLAQSLNNLSIRLGDLGRPDEALTAITEAVDIRRRLVDANPAAYLPDLAMSLNNLSVRLGALGRPDEGLTAITEAVDVYRRLADANPAAYLPDLAMSLNNLSVDLGELGRPDEALTAITEAVNIRRRLADANPAAYLPNLAMSLNNLSVRLGALGRPDEGLTAITEAVNIRRRLADANPAAYLPNLAASLNNLSLRLGDLGRPDEGLTAITEAVNIRRRLADANPAAYLPNLAQSLNNLANTYDQLNQPDNATKTRTELQETQQRLA